MISLPVYPWLVDGIATELGGVPISSQVAPTVGRYGNRRKKDTMNLTQSTAFNFPVFMFDSADHVSGKAGLTLTISASKNGGTAAAITPTVTDLGNGRYNLALTTSHTDTLGALTLLITATGADPSIYEALVTVAPAVAGGQMDLVNAPNSTAITAIQSGLSKPGTAQTISSNADITAIKAKTDNLPASPAAVGSQMDLVNAPNSTAIAAIQLGLSKPGTAQTISSNADITAIKAKTDNLPASPAAVSDVPTVAQIADGVWDEVLSGHLTGGSTGAALNGAGSAGDPWTATLPGAYGAGTAGKIIGDNINASIAAVKAKTDNLPASPAAVSDIPSAATNASAVRTELATELSRVDVAISTRSAPGTAQTITSNADITAIKAKTDNLPASPAAVSDIPSAASIASAVGGRTVPKTGNKTYDQVLEISAALACAKLTGMVTGEAGTTTLRTVDDTQDLVVATQDANGNRTAVTVTP